MGKWCDDEVLDAAVNFLKNNSTRLCVCSQHPTTYAEATITYKLAIKTISGSDFTGPANGDASGRKLTVNEQNGVAVDVQGDPVEIALCDSVNSKLRYTTTEGTSQILYVGNTCNIPAWDIELADPA